MNDDPGTDAAAFLEKEQANKQSLMARLINIRKILNDLLISWTIRTATWFRVLLSNRKLLNIQAMRLKDEEKNLKVRKKTRWWKRKWGAQENLEPTEGIPHMSKDKTAEPQAAVPKLGPEEFQRTLLFSRLFRKKPKKGPEPEALVPSDSPSSPKPGF